MRFVRTTYRRTLRVFKAWRIERNKVATDKCLLESPDIHIIPIFNPSTSTIGSPILLWSVDGKMETLTSILAGLYRYSRNCCNGELTGALQVRFRQLREEGIGAQVIHAL